MDDALEEWYTLMMASEKRSEALRIVEGEATTEWATTLQNLTPFELKFALNGCQDTLPHNANLVLLKGYSSEYKLCGGRQTHLHVSGCSTTSEVQCQIMFSMLSSTSEGAPSH